jgi:PAS domain-containing protein
MRLAEGMNQAVWNLSSSNDQIIVLPTKRSISLSATLLIGGLLLLSLTLFSFLIGLSIILTFLLAHRESKILSGMKRFQALVDHSTNPMLIADKNGFARYMNPAFVCWSGMNPSSLIGQNLFDIMVISQEKQHNESLWKVAKPVLISGKMEEKLCLK